MNSASSAFLAAASLLMLAAPPASAAPPLRLEAESARRIGNVAVTRERPGFSGAGYVTHFQDADDALEWTVIVPKTAIYQVRIRYASASEKGYDLAVNGRKQSGMFAPAPNGFATHTGGSIKLRAGQNTLALHKGWGYYDIDCIDLALAPLPRPLLKLPATLVDAKATPAARALMARLVRAYGTRMLSGQYDARESDYIREVTGQTPAIIGGDFMDYSPSRLPFGADGKQLSEKMIARARAGQIVTLSWHWNAPTHLINKSYTNKDGKTIDAAWYRGFYTDATTFDLEAALANPTGAEYKLLLSDMDAIAIQLKKFARANVPVLWRPLHETEGRWFWWGAKGPRPFVQLWQLMYDRLTNYHGLHNLIWVYTGSGSNWYPGDRWVDIVGVDAYPTDPTDPLSGTWEDYRKRFDGKKLVALTEVGKVPDVDRMRRFGVRWAYFVSWTGDLGPLRMPHADVKRIYNSPVVLNKPEPR